MHSASATDLPRIALPRIGCIGLGVMGRPIAEHLAKAGYPLTLYARRKEVFETDLKHLVDQGAAIAETLSLIHI